MANILAIDTSTDACSVALYSQGQYRHRHEVLPREHFSKLMPMLQALLPDGNLRAAGIDAIAYGVGPGSFTGLRIAASAVQGLAFANDIPAIPVSTLACQVQTAIRENQLADDSWVLSTLDARINEIYWSLFRVESGLVQLIQGPAASSPECMFFDCAVDQLYGIGGGLKYLEMLPADVRDKFKSVNGDVLPSALDLIPLAMDLWNKGLVQTAAEVAPVYVRDEISWKKLADQGKPQ